MTLLNVPGAPSRAAQNKMEKKNLMLDAGIRMKNDLHLRRMFVKSIKLLLDLICCPDIHLIKSVRIKTA
jgi:hypothetical protein